MQQNPISRPEISIIVPVYTVEQYLRCCLDSILGQTFLDWECILVDDGSLDKSGLICDEYVKLDSRFRVIHQQNKGVAAARKVGLSQVTGKYTIMLDSDDYVEPAYLDCLYKKAIENNSDVVICDVIHESTTGNRIIKMPRISSGKEAIKLMIGYTMSGSLCNRLILTSLYEKVLFIPGLDYAEDMMAMVYVFYYSEKISYCDDVFYHYVMHNGSLSVSYFSEKRCSMILKLTQLVAEFLSSVSDFDNFAESVSVMWAATKNLLLFGSTPKIRKTFLPVLYSYPGDLRVIEKRFNVVRRLVIHLFSLKKFFMTRIMLKIFDFRFLLRIKGVV